MLKLKADVTVVKRETARSIRGVSQPVGPAPDQEDLGPRFAVLQDRLAAGDHVAARIIAAELRLSASAHPVLLRETGRAWLIAGSVEDAAQDLNRSVQLDANDVEAWYLLGLARNDGGDIPGAMLALQNAAALSPDNPQVAGVLAAIEARAETAWQGGLRRLIDLQEQYPADDGLRDRLSEVYLVHAFRGWTQVREEQGDTIVDLGKSLLRLAAGNDIPPGDYPTTAVHVKNAAVCLERLQALESKDPDIAAAVSELEILVKNNSRRSVQGTWGELGFGVMFFLFGLFALSQALALGLFALATGAGLFAGSFVPQYRINRIALSRRGETLGDSALGFFQRSSWGRIAYFFVFACTYPFIAAYKVHVNWVEGWLANSEIASIEASPPPDPDPAPQAALEVIEESDAVERPVASQQGTLAEEADTTHVAQTVAPEMSTPPLAPAPAIQDAVTRVEPQPPAAVPAVAAQAPLSGGATQAIPAATSTLARLNPTKHPRRPGPQWQFAKSLNGWLQGLKLPALPQTSPAGLASAGGAVLILAVGGGLLLWFKPFKPDAADVAQPIAQTATAPAQAPAVRALTGKPTVVDTANLIVAGQPVRLQGVLGAAGLPAQQMDSFIHEQGGVITCDPLSGGLYRCWTSGGGGRGYDIAAAAIVNGGAKASGDAPPDYLQMQSTAQAERRGVWR